MTTKKFYTDEDVTLMLLDLMSEIESLEELQMLKAKDYKEIGDWENENFYLGKKIAYEIAFNQIVSLKDKRSNYASITIEQKDYE